ncbi:glycosyltransferase [Bradyrhizobium sp. NFR13]|uniref:glycosyltransferase n=1 Tax=Bradyrhizobium sp. NFR13 TaxID=1566285 RepID=UPI0015877695|nr:glycosyltransferase [Bradyrhizobium sp. NFR13]
MIYFTVVPISSAANGGNIACRNHIDRLNRDPNIDLRVLAAPTFQDSVATEEYLRKAEIEHIVIPRKEGNFHQADNTVASTLRFAALSAVYFPWELEAHAQPQYDDALEWAMRHWQADLILIDYTFSALFCPRVMRGPIKKAIVTFNREAEFYRDMIGLGMIKHDRFSAEISARRLARFERNAYRQCDKVIAISANDLPSYVPAERKSVIVPYLDPRLRWSFTNTNALFFVGNIGHYPNREAIEFLATRLAPQLEAVSPSTIIKIVGASSADVPKEWLHPKIEYLGFSDSVTVDLLFRSCDAMISPIKNTYGMKFKMAEAVAYGTPLISSSEALECLPYIEGAQAFPFGDGKRAASLVARVIGNRNELESISGSMIASSEAYISSQKTRWSEELAPLVQ